VDPVECRATLSDRMNGGGEPIVDGDYAGAAAAAVADMQFRASKAGAVLATRRQLHERNLRAEIFGADPPPLASDDLHRTGDREVTDALAGALMDAGRDHPTRRAPRRLGRDDSTRRPPSAVSIASVTGYPGRLKRVLAAPHCEMRRLAHDLWSLSGWMSSQHPSQPKAASPSLPGPARHLYAQPRRATRRGTSSSPERMRQ